MSKVSSASSVSQRSIIRKYMIRLLKTAGAQLIELAAAPLTTYYKGVRAVDPRTIQKIVNSLIYDGELERTDNNQYRLTDIGAIHLLPLIKPILATDGKTRILVFDIPESHRRLRNTFRHHIKNLGFRQHQQSVWVSKYQCEDWIDWLVDYHDVRKYCSLFIGKLVK